MVRRHTSAPCGLRLFDPLLFFGHLTLSFSLNYEMILSVHDDASIRNTNSRVDRRCIQTPTDCDRIELSDVLRNQIGSNGFA